MQEEQETDCAIGNIYLGPLTVEEGINTKGNPSSDKFFVIVGQDKGGNFYGCVLINSKPRNILELQHLLNVSDYDDILRHDSYVDCSKIFSFNQNVIDRCEYKRDLIEGDITDVRKMLAGAPTIPPKIKKQYELIPIQ